MFQHIVRFAVTKKLFVGLTTLFLLAGGIYAMLTLPVDAVPDITNNQVQIVTVSPTLAPQEVEQLITFVSASRSSPSYSRRVSRSSTPGSSSTSRYKPSPERFPRSWERPR